MSTRKWASEADNYICTLSEDLRKLAKDELHEDNSSRTQALTFMRHWIMNNPRIINCRLDSTFLLCFLRRSKFSLLKAQQNLEKTLLFLHIYNVVKFDMRIPQIDELLNLGWAFACPKRDHLGRRILFARPDVVDLNRFTKDDIFRVFGVCFGTVIEDEENQVRGFVDVIDFKGFGLQFLTLFSMKEIVYLSKYGEEIILGRHKEVHILNIHPTIRFFCDLIMSHLSEKMKARVRLYSSTNDFKNSGNIENDLLPQEYGGTVPMKEIIAQWKEEVKCHQDKTLLCEQFRINPSLFSAKEKQLADLCNDFVDIDSHLGISGTFRKLEID